MSDTKTDWWRHGTATGAVLGAFWTLTMAVTVAVVMAFATGELFRPLVVPSLAWGGAVGFVAVWRRDALWPAALALIVLGWAGYGPLYAEASLGAMAFGQVALAVGVGLGLRSMCAPLPKGAATKHEW
ncbi:MAG: carbohydrate ABC transporter permease, partial [Pseudomonadota bacterium]